MRTCAPCLGVMGGGVTALQHGQFPTMFCTQILEHFARTHRNDYFGMLEDNMFVDISSTAELEGETLDRYTYIFTQVSTLHAR